MIYLATLTAIVTIGGVGLLSMLMGNSKPSKKKMPKELDALRSGLKKITGELVSIGQEELDLFSYSQENKYLRKGSRLLARGVFVTLFHERIVAYSFKKYFGGKIFNNSILLALTANHEFVFDLNKNGIVLIVDGHEVGTIKNGGKLYGKKTKKVLAQALPEKNNQIIVVTYDREVAAISLPSAPEGGKEIGQRVFAYVKNDLKEEERLLLIALTTLELVLREVSP